MGTPHRHCRGLALCRGQRAADRRVRQHQRGDHPAAGTAGKGGHAVRMPSLLHWCPDQCRARAFPPISHSYIGRYDEGSNACTPSEQEAAWAMWPRLCLACVALELGLLSIDQLSCRIHSFRETGNAGRADGQQGREGDIVAAGQGKPVSGSRSGCLLASSPACLARATCWLPGCFLPTSCMPLALTVACVWMAAWSISQHQGREIGCCCLFRSYPCRTLPTAWAGWPRPAVHAG